MKASHFRYEVLSKAIAKSSGMLKQLCVLVFIGVNVELDAFYVATSYVGIILAVNAWSEIILLPVLVKEKKIKERRKLLAVFVQYTLFFTLFLFVLCIITGWYVYGDNYLPWLFGVGFWAVINVINCIHILAFRADEDIDKVTSYYAKSSVAGSLLFISMILLNYLFFDTENYKVELLLISIIIPELYFLFKNTRTKSYFIKLDFKNSIIATSFMKKLTFTKQSILTIVILLLVLGIDIVDKYFTTLESKIPIGASILIYGSLIPLVLRNTLDIKALFYASLQQKQTISEQLKLLSDTYYKIMKIYLPLIFIINVAVFFMGHFVFSLIKINSQNASAIISVFFVYSLLTPFYIYWDLLYRMFHRNKQAVAATFIVLLGFLSNIMLNYVFVIQFELGALGIALSTCFVFFSYSCIGYIYFRKQASLSLI